MKSKLAFLLTIMIGVFSPVTLAGNTIGKIIEVKKTADDSIVFIKMETEPPGNVNNASV